MHGELGEAVVARKGCKANPPQRTPSAPSAPPEPPQDEDVDLATLECPFDEDLLDLLPASRAATWGLLSSEGADEGLPMGQQHNNLQPTTTIFSGSDDEGPPVVHQRHNRRQSTILLEDEIVGSERERARQPLRRPPTILLEALSAECSGEEVSIHVYDLGPVTGRLNQYLRAFHCGVEVSGAEWSFQGFKDASDDPTVTGIVSCAPRCDPAYTYRQSVPMGKTMLSEVAVDSLLDDLAEEWPANSYHLVSHNCLDFAEEFVRLLQLPEPFPIFVRGAVNATTGTPAVHAIADYGWTWLKWMSQTPEPRQPSKKQALPRADVADFRRASLSSLSEEDSPKPKMALAVGQAAEELVFPPFFVGAWGCVGELVKAETGSAGEAALGKALPGADESLRAASGAIGTEKGAFRTRRRWLKTTRSPPQAEGPGALEDRGGTTLGAFAAAQLLAGPGAKVKPVAQGMDQGTEEDSFVVMVKGKRWRIEAAGAVERPDPEIEDSFKVSELFSISDPTGKMDVGELCVRVVTVWRRVPSDAKSQKESAEDGSETIDSSRPYIAQAVQVAYLLPQPQVQSDLSLASYTTRFLYYPILSS